MNFNVLKKFATTWAVSISLLSSALASPLDSLNFGFERVGLSRALEERPRISGRAALTDYIYLSAVGGVGFHEKISFKSNSVTPRYNPELRDGMRFSLELNGREYTVPAYDWELLPLVEYVASSFTGMVSVLGDGPDPGRYRYIRYHSAFDETHLGLRLLQSDVLLMDVYSMTEDYQFSNDVPFRNEPNVASRHVRLRASNFMDYTLMSSEYQSWLLTDIGTQPKMVIEDDTITIRAYPYFYFWTSDPTRLIRLSERRNRLETEVRELRWELKKITNSNERAEQLMSKKEDLQRLIEHKQDELSSLDRRLSRPDDLISVIPLEHLTAAVREKMQLVADSAPRQFAAMRRTAGLSALLRGIKDANPIHWPSFVYGVRIHGDLPKVPTPTRFRRPDPEEALLRYWVRWQL